MPLPAALAQLVNDPTFWMHYCHECNADDWGPARHPLYGRLQAEPVEITVAPGKSLRLTISEDTEHNTFYPLTIALDLIHPKLVEPVRVTSRASMGNWDGLRWEEVDLLGRCVALADPTIPHPGVIVALLSPLTPLAKNDDAEAVRPLLEAAWQPLDMPAWRTNWRIDQRDAREAEFEWKYAKQQGWTASQEMHGAWLTKRVLLSSRKSTNQTFPFSVLADYFDAAKKCYANARDPRWDQWNQGAVRDIAQRIFDDRDLTSAPVLADALEDAGETNDAIIDALRDISNQARQCCMVELIADVPRGAFLKRYFGKPWVPAKKGCWLIIASPATHTQPVVEALNGQLAMTQQGVLRGSTGASIGDPSTDRIYLDLICDLDSGLAMVSAILRQLNAPPETRIETYDPDHRFLPWQ